MGRCENKSREMLYIGICQRYRAVDREGRKDETDDERAGKIFKGKGLELNVRV